MTALATVPEEVHDLRTLVDRASSALAGARTAAEVLDARDMAALAYDAAKRAARLQRAKQAHDDLIGAAHRAQAHALEIEAQAKHRLADEYDAAQARGEIRRSGERSFSTPEKLGNHDLGIAPKEIHEARLVRDAETVAPGIVRRTLDEKLARGEEPTKAALRKMVVDAAMRGLRPVPRKKRAKNPVYEADPAFDASAAIDSCSTRITEILNTHGADFILSGCLDTPMLARSITKMTNGRNSLTTILEAAHAK